MSKSFYATDPNTHQSENTWFTPIDFKVAQFDLDPCTVSYRPHDMASNSIEHDKGFCGLSIKWKGDVFLNPPYGKEITPFLEKFTKHKKGVCLIFARMGNKDVQRLVKSGAYFYMLRKRVRFIDKKGVTRANAGADSCLVFYDKKWFSVISEKFEGVLMRSGE